MGDVSEAQRDLANVVKGCGYIGQMALQESKLHTGILDELGHEARQAYGQRNEALHHLSQSSNSLVHIGRGVQGTNTRLDALNKNMHGTNTRLELIDQHMSGLLGDIGESVSEMTDELITSRVEILDMLQEMQGTFLWSHREKMWVMNNMYQALTNPRATKANEEWQIGERCRHVGDTRNAVRLFKDGIQSNPSDPRNYFSVGLMELNVGRARSAIDWLERSTEYALLDKNTTLAAYSIMHIAKVEMYENHYPRASKLFQQALKLDSKNLECWYELAVCECKLGNFQDAMRILSGLISRSRKYMLKIIMEPAFFPLHHQLNQFMRKILHT